jgi:hypothetical protein
MKNFLWLLPLVLAACMAAPESDTQAAVGRNAVRASHATGTATAPDIRQ